MRLASPWTPRLTAAASPAEALSDALAEDILGGALQAGDRLPAHRDLAHVLGIGLGSVTRAYGMLERRGLVRSVRGRGTFVAHVEARRGAVIDLSRNVPPAVMTDRLLARTLSALARRADAGFFNDYPPPGGHEEHRRLMARWFARMGMEADPDHLLLTSGAHHALAVALDASGAEVVLTEAQTYPGLIQLARHRGLPLTGLAMDAEGLRPDALAAALAGRRAVLYLTPTLQNPTGATIGAARRAEIAALCRRHDALIIEDDVYSLDAALPPLAMLAPERTFYVNSLSKTLNPSLRIGGLVVPPALRGRATEALLATAVMVSPLGCAVMGQWLTDGTADIVLHAIAAEAGRRADLGRAILRDVPEGRGYHLWLPMPMAEALRVEEAAADLGILVTPPGSTAVSPQAGGGIRLCLGGPSLANLEIGLRGIEGVLRDAS